MKLGTQVNGACLGNRGFDLVDQPLVRDDMGRVLSGGSYGLLKLDCEVRP